VLPALMKAAEVTLWTDQPSWQRDLGSVVPVRRFRADRLPFFELNRADVTFYNIGNNPQFHGGIWEASRLLSGVVVLHDLRLHHFFDGIFRVKFRDLQSYLAAMKRFYGVEGERDAAVCFQNDATNIDYMAERYPLTELALENAAGVVVHTGEAFTNLSQKKLWPIAYAPLPFPAPPASSQIRRDEGQYKLIVFGYIGRNRRLDSILTALGRSSYKARYQLDVYGTILNDEKRLRELISSLGLGRQVAFHGYKTEDELDEALGRADLAINLRYPTMGEASGSQLRIWAHSLPSLVSKVGWYASLPKGTVALVRTDEHEIGDIASHLGNFVENPSHFSEMGHRGRRVLEEHHSPAAYVATILELGQAAQLYRSKLAGLELANRTSLIATRCFSPDVLSELFPRVATEIHALAEEC
jgi:glycosyltransferase involved in cell wall biosynthesis